VQLRALGPCDCGGRPEARGAGPQHRPARFRAACYVTHPRRVLQAFSQLPLQDSEHLLAACPFEPDQKRTARRCYAIVWDVDTKLEYRTVNGVAAEQDRAF
jgi:hypothetical protein